MAQVGGNNSCRHGDDIPAKHLQWNRSHAGGGRMKRIILKIDEEKLTGEQRKLPKEAEA